MLKLLQQDLEIARCFYHALRKHVVEHGLLPDETLFEDTHADIARWAQEIKNIDIIKGFHIDLFSESSARHKGMKNTPRMIIFLSNVFEGDVGAPPEGILGKSLSDPTAYRTGYLPGQASNLVFALHLMSIDSKQSSILNSIRANVLGQRGFIDHYDQERFPGKKIFYRATSFADLDNPQENILEKVYYYEVPNVFMGDEVVTRPNVSPIKEILVTQTMKSEGKEYVANTIKVPYASQANDSFTYTLPFILDSNNTN